MTASIYTPEFNISIIGEGIKSIMTDEPTYIYFANVPQATNTGSEVDKRAIVNNIILGKRIVTGDFRYLTKKIAWTSGIKYDEYDDSTVDNGNYLVYATNRGIYKCISNGDVLSTVEPSSLDNDIFTLADGYSWKLIYRLTATELNEYSTTTHVPIGVDSLIVAAAVRGTVDRIEIVNQGSDYITNSGNILGKVGDSIFRVSDTAENSNNVFNNYTFHTINGGMTQISSIVSSYTANSSGKWIEVNPPLAGAYVGGLYSINPTIVIDGDGEDAKYKVVVDEGRIVSTTPISRGHDYRFATATILETNARGSGATIRPVISPINGHGSDPIMESDCDSLLLYMKILGDEYLNIPENTTYNVFGIAKNFKSFANSAAVFDGLSFDSTVKFSLASLSGTINVGDILFNSNGTVKMKVLQLVEGKYICSYTLNTQMISGITLFNENGASGIVVDAVQPEVYTSETEIISLTRINSMTILRDVNETVKITLGI